ncbi:hypothetical protein Tco_0723302 [Tanacetum coccineum]
MILMRMQDDDLMFDIGVLNDEKVFAGQDMVEKEVSTADLVTTAGEVVTTANVEVSTVSPTATTITNVELTLAQTLVESKSVRPKTKGVVMQEPSESITTTTIPLKDKGKGIMVEEPLKIKKKDQIIFDEQEAIRLQAKFDEKVRLAREKDEANVALIKEWNDIQAKIDDDYQLAQRIEESSSKRAGDELEQEKEKKQKVDEDKETTELQSLMKIIPDEEEVAVDAISLATKPPSIVDYKIIKEGKISYYQIIRADGSSKRPEEGYERVLCGDLKTMFEHHVEDLVWRNLQGNKVLVWKLFDSCGVHFVRFQSLHVFMLVEKRYPLTPTTITEMLNKKLQADHWNEMCYQLLKLIIMIVGIKRLLDDLRVTAAQDTKKLLETVEKRFGGNAATKKTQRNLLKQLLRSLSPEWNTHVVVWRNKADLDTMSMDDLYNNLKVYEPEVKG